MKTPKVMSLDGTLSGQRKERGPPSEKRKSQNREAQRKYREKLKNRLKSLELLTGETELVQQEPPIVLNQPVDQRYGFEQHSIPVEQLTRVGPSIPMNQVDPILTFEEAHPPSPDIPDETFTMLASNPTNESLPFLADESSFWIPDSVETTPKSSQAEFPDFEAFDFPGAGLHFDESLGPITNLTYEPIEASLLPSASSSRESIHLESLKKFDSTASPQSLDRSPQPFPKELTSSLQPYRLTPKRRDSSQSTTKKLASHLIDQLRLEETNENQCLVRTAIARGHNIRDVLLAGLQVLGNDEQSGHQSSVRLPDLRKNTLTLVHTSTLQAYLSVAEAAGIHIPDLYPENAISPFYNSRATPADITALLAMYASKMLPDLRPTAPQIQFAHHPWLDLLPFPTLRERALILSSMSPPLLNAVELKNDIFVNNGLLCWRAGEASGSGCGQPWDRRSWEAEPWFLKKWWMLLGGEDTDIWHQTKWWREFRGESKIP